MPSAALVDVNLLDLTAEPTGESAPHALGRRLPAMVAALLRAAGLSVRHQSATIALGGERKGWAVPAGLLDEGDAIEMSRRLGPARFLAHGQIGPSRPQGMTLVVKVLKRQDAGLVAEVDKDFFKEEILDAVVHVARAIAEPCGAAEVLDGLDPAAILGTASGRALLRLQEGLDGVTALEGGIEGADGLLTAEHLVAAVEEDDRCGEALGRAVQVLATWVEETDALPLSIRLQVAAPADEPALLLLARLHQRRGALDEALGLLSAPSAAATTRVAAELARVQLSLGRTDDAERTCRGALGGKGNKEGRAEAEIHQLLALALARGGQLEESEASLRTAVGLDPDHVQAWANLGRSLHLLGRHEEASSAYDRAMELDPASWEVARNYAELAAELGDISRATSLLQTWVERRPDDPEAVLALGDLLAITGSSDEAEQLLEDGVTRFEDDPRLLALLGGVLVHAGKVQAAEARYREALDLRPNDPALMSNVALLLAERGELAEAERLADKATTLAPEDTVAAQVLAHIRSKN